MVSDIHVKDRDYNKIMFIQAFEALDVLGRKEYLNSLLRIYAFNLVRRNDFHIQSKTSTIILH